MRARCATTALLPRCGLGVLGDAGAHKAAHLHQRLAGAEELQNGLDAEGLAAGRAEGEGPATYEAKGNPRGCLFLEMLDIVNSRLAPRASRLLTTTAGKGSAGAALHDQRSPAGQQGDHHLPAYMRKFHHGDTIVIEPFRARAFPVVKDLVVDRSAFDKIIQAGASSR